MGDIVHSALKQVSYNRFTAIAAILSTIVVSSCGLLEPKVRSPISETKVTSEQLQAELNKLKDEKIAEIAKEQQVLQLTLEELNVNYTTQVKTLTTKSNFKLEEINRYMTTVTQQVAASVEEAEKQKSKIADLINGAISVISTVVPGWGPIVGTASTLLAGGLLADNRRKNKLLNIPDPQMFIPNPSFDPTKPISPTNIPMIANPEYKA